jgi:hypothetical protein
MCFRVIALFCLVAASTGCTRVAAVQIRNPATAGQVEPNRVILAYERPERYHALPSGSLADEASLVSFEPRGACFAVTLRNLGDAAALSDLGSYQVSLLADEEPLELAHAAPHQSEVRQYQGQVPETQHTGESTYCAYRDPNTQACNEWRTQPVYQTVMVPGIVNVVAGGGNLCFTNNGMLGPHTEIVALEFRNRRGTGERRRFAFEWQFVGSLPRPEPQEGGAQVANR